MTKLSLAILSAVAITSTGSAQGLGTSWFFSIKGENQPIVSAPFLTWDNVFLKKDLNLELTFLTKPFDDVRIGNSLQFSFPLGKPRTGESDRVEVRGVIGLGVLYGLKPFTTLKDASFGLIAGFNVRF